MDNTGGNMKAWMNEIAADLKVEWPALLISAAILYGMVYVGFRVTFH